MERCGTRIIMRQLRDAMADVLDRTSLADLLRQVEEVKPEKRKPDSLMYYI